MKELVNEVEHFNNGDLDLKVVVDENGDIKFDTEQVAIGLGISLVKKEKQYVRWERVRSYLNSPQLEKGDFITEPQFYDLAIKASSKVAQNFQHWVTHEVLPSIRKHGAYMTDKKIEQVLTDPDTIIQLATQLKEEKQGRLIAEQKVNEYEPKATYYDLVLSSRGGVSN